MLVDMNENIKGRLKQRNFKKWANITEIDYKTIEN